MHTNTYGRTSFDVFLSAEPVAKPKAKARCAIHDGTEYDGPHCPKCWSEKAVPMPEFVKAELQNLIDGGSDA